MRDGDDDATEDSIMRRLAMTTTTTGDADVVDDEEADDEDEEEGCFGKGVVVGGAGAVSVMAGKGAGGGRRTDVVYALDVPRNATSLRHSIVNPQLRPDDLQALLATILGFALGAAQGAGISRSTSCKATARAVWRPSRALESRDKTLSFG